MDCGQRRLSGSGVTQLGLVAVSGASVQLISGGGGDYWLAARLIGYRPANTCIRVPRAGHITVVIPLDPPPVQLDTLFVRGALTPGEREFESRRHLKWNFSYDWTQFKAFHAGSVRDVIQFGLPGGMFSCRPLVYLDGTKMRTFTIDNLPLDWVYGIETYRTYYDMPVKYRDPFADRGCGAVLVWTHPVGWKPPR